MQSGTHIQGVEGGDVEESKLKHGSSEGFSVADSDTTDFSFKIIIPCLTITSCCVIIKYSRFCTHYMSSILIAFGLDWSNVYNWIWLGRITLCWVFYLIIVCFMQILWYSANTHFKVDFDLIEYWRRWSWWCWDMRLWLRE